jgi:hypothetical protein
VGQVDLPRHRVRQREPRRIERDNRPVGEAIDQQLNDGLSRQSAFLARRLR